MQAFEGDDAIDADLSGAVDDAEAAACDFVDDLVAMGDNVSHVELARVVLRGYAMLNMYALVAAVVAGILWQGERMLIEHERVAGDVAGILGQGDGRLFAHFRGGDVGIGAGSGVSLAGYGQDFVGQKQRLGFEDFG